jgi:hypothetical protein
MPQPANKNTTQSPSDSPGDHVVGWRPPLMRHLDANGNLIFATLRVRILLGEAEQDFNAKFEPGPLLVSDVVDHIGKKLNPQMKKLFSLWIIGRDLGMFAKIIQMLELQLRSDINLFELVEVWPLM